MVVKLKKFEIEHLINEMSFKAITVVKCDFFQSSRNTTRWGVYNYRHNISNPVN